MRELLDAEEQDRATYEEFRRYATVYFPAYRDGHLLVRGGVADQPARYNAMIREMSDLASRLELRHIELTKEQT